MFGLVPGQLSTTDMPSANFERERDPSQDLKSLACPDPQKHELGRISVCVCTYKRPDFLKRLLKELNSQITNGLFTHSIVVADNDRLRSAETIVSDFAASSHVPITYCVEPRQN